MGSKRNTFPRTYAQSTREIFRTQRRFDQGMFRDVDPFEVGPESTYARAVTYLKNCRGYKGGIQGETGTVRFVAADFCVTITDNTETLSVAMQSGEIFSANGDAIPEAADIFELRGTGDFTGNDLATAKGEAVRPYDNFKIIDSGAGTEEIVFIGNSRLPAIPGFGDTVATEITATKTTDTITRTSGPSFTTELVGSYFVWDYAGNRDPITEYVDENTLKTSNSGTASGTMCRIEGAINASWFHKSLKKLVILSARTLFVAEGVPPYGWKRLGRLSEYKPANVNSHPMYEDGDDLILVNGTGLFRLKIDTEEPWCYKMNESVPVVQLSDGSTDTSRAYGHRGLYCLSLITGAGINCDRFSSGAVLEHTSGPVEKDGITGKDYAEQWLTTAIDDSSNALQWGTFNYPSDARAFSHYSFYKTKSIGTAGIAAGNKRNTFLWAKDVPVAKGLTVSRAASGVITATRGVFKKEDEGSTILFADGSSDIISGYLTEATAQGLVLSALTEQSACIGSDTVLTASLAGDDITITAGRALTSDDEGKILFFSEGFTIIKSVLTTTTAKAAWSDNFESQGAAIDPTFREIKDDISDAVLETRANSQDEMYYLQTRFFSPLPDVDIGCVVPGFLIVAKYTSNEYSYCELGRRYLSGYYKSSEQYNDKIKDGITQIRAYPDVVIIRCTNSTYKLNTMITTDAGEAELGESYQVLEDPSDVDTATGSIGQNDSVRLPKGGEIVITSEPAIRVFDGQAYGRKLDSFAVNKSEIRKFKRPAIMSYSPRAGLRIYGSQE